MIEFTAHASSSGGNLYTLDDGKTRIIIDPGLPIAQIKKALDFKLSGISGALCTHGHRDHAEGTAGIMTAGIDLYCSQDTANTLELSGHRLHIIKHKKPFTVGTFTVLPFSVPHDIPNLAFVLTSGKHKCLFMIDALYCPYHFIGLTHIFLGINFDNDILRENVRAGSIDPALARRIMSNHMSLGTALNFFKAQDLSKVQEIHVLHCSESNLDKDKAKTEIQKLSGKVVII
ncbi:MAG: MBL fold metallo-hydrolase [Proteobacteria bacterium]|nr:MBL fold metallo-hydrolase [Pseudomonadota bacterium]